MEIPSFAIIFTLSISLFYCLVATFPPFFSAFCEQPCHDNTVMTAQIQYVGPSVTEGQKEWDKRYGSEEEKKN